MVETQELNIALLESLMDEYGDYLKRTAYLYLGDIQIAEDMVQETFIKFYTKIYQFNNKASYKTYLYRILMNNCKMYFRKSSKDVEYKIDHQVTSFEDVLVNKRVITDKILELDVKSREVIILFYYNQWSVQEISEILKVSKSSVKMRLKRARNKLEIKLVKEEYYEV